MGSSRTKGPEDLARPVGLSAPSLCYGTVRSGPDRGGWPHCV